MKASILSAAAVTLLAGAAFGQNDVMVAPAGSQPSINPNITWGGNDATLWDNGGFDGLNGLSNATSVPFGARRTILMDFIVPSGQTWNITGLEWLAVWNSLPPGSGTGAELRFYNDSANSPGTPITSTMTSTSYSETATGNVNFSRPEYRAVAAFPSTTLTAGRYWTDATVVGPENNFWETAAVREQQVWVDYADFGGLQPGQNVFGVQYDVTGIITGTTGGGGYTLSVTGACPGNVTISWTGAGSGQHGLVLGNNLGSFTIPSGQPCQNTVLGITGGIMLIDPPGIFSTGGGSGSISGNCPGAVSGKRVQGVRGGSPCVTSNVIQLP
jgi:hypothetical protein